MDQNQINQVKATLENYSSIDVEKLIAEAYKDNKDLSSVNIGDFTAIELVSTLNKAFAQLEEELDTTFAKSLPFQYDFRNEYGSGNLTNDLNQIITYIQGNQFTNIPAFLNRIIHYQAINGFWGKSKRKYFSLKEKNLFEETERRRTR